MKAGLRKTWEARAPQERKLIIALALLLAAVLYGGLLFSAGRARAPLRVSVSTLQAQAARLNQQAFEYQQLASVPPASASATDLRPLVQARIDATGLSSALTRIDAPDADQVVLVFGAVAFADWLKLLDSLQSQQIRLDTCRIEALSTPGMVSVTATLVRPTPQ